MNFNLILAGICVPLCLTASSLSEKKFGPQPYIDYLNADAESKYKTLTSSGINLNSSTKQFFKSGKHTIRISGREPGAILKSIELIPENITAGIVKINLSDGKLVPPMKLENNTIIGGNNSGSATFLFSIPKDGNYTIRGKSWGATEAANSFFVSIDNSKNFIWDVPKTIKEPESWTIVKPRDAGYYRIWSFPLSWGATSPHSKYYNDPEFRKVALTIIKPAITALANRRVRPKELWFLDTLEAVNMWISDKRTDNIVKADLLKAMKPYVEGCYNLIQKHDGWCDNTPNIQIQSAAILGLASSMWKNTDPQSAAKWQKTAEECMERAWKWKITDGPFVYSYGSGPDAEYYSYDGKNLTCYYLATKSSKARKALEDLAKGANNTTSFGHPVFLGSPWWKHCYHDFDRTNTNGSRLSLYPLLLGHNPIYAMQVIADQQRGFRKPYPAAGDLLLAYYNSLVPEFTCPTQKISNQTFFSKPDNGPFLRMGSYNVSMPWHSWCETTCGAFYSTSNKVDSQICSTILTAITPDTKGKVVKAYYPLGYSVVEMVKPQPDIRAAIIDKSFIASATIFRPALGGPALPKFANQPNDSPWQRCDIYFADENGYAGTTELEALRDNNCVRIAMWTRCSVNNLKISENSINVSGMSLELEKSFSGKLINRGKIWGPPQGSYPLDLIESTVNDSNGKGYKKGSRFATKVSARFSGKARLTVGEHDLKDGIEKVQILKNGKFYAQLLFNRNKETKMLKCDRSYSSIMQSNNAAGKAEPLSSKNEVNLPPHSLTICK